MVKSDPYPLDEFPDQSEAESLFRPFGFNIHNFMDEPELYILVLMPGIIMFKPGDQKTHKH